LAEISGLYSAGWELLFMSVLIPLWSASSSIRRLKPTLSFLFFYPQVEAYSFFLVLLSAG
jgi:hypothetical protein